MKHLSRRLFLGGAGVTLALPFLESILPRRARADLGTPPKRLLFFYVPNGIHMPSWIPTSTGPDYQTPYILEPLSDIRQHLTVISNLDNLPGRPDGPGDHAGGTGAFLTCKHVRKTEGDDIENDISIDQVAATALAGQTSFSSLELGIDGGHSVGGCDSGYSCAYTRNISWAGPQTPRPKIVNPHVVFDRLFGGSDPTQTAAYRERRLRERLSVLDFVRGESQALQRRISRDDKLKLDEYETSVRDLETRLNSTGTGPVCEAPGEPPAQFDVTTHFELMTELMVTAFRCDLTRVITFMAANAGSGRSYTFLNPTLTGGHHDLSHHQNLPENHRKLEQINRWEVNRFGDIVRRLATITESDGSSALDNTTLYFSSEIADGNSHSHSNLPVLLAGGGGGLVRPGRHLAAPAKTSMANLFLGMLKTVGVEADTFGQDSTGVLDLS